MSKISRPIILSAQDVDVRESRPAQADIDAVQLARLAATVLAKSPADLAALAAANPHVAKEWIEAFGRAKAEAETAARFWSAAMAALSTVAPMRLAIAAE